MQEFIEKYQALPAKIRANISSPQKVAEAKKLDAKYQLDLGDLILRIIVKELTLDQLVNYLVQDLQMVKTKAEALKVELEEKIFFDLQDFLLEENSEKIDHPKIVKTESTPGPVPMTQEKIIPQKTPQPNLKNISKEVPREVVFNSMPMVEKENTSESLDEAEAKIEKLIKKANINFSSQLMGSRFRQILRTYLKGIRNRFDTKATILKPFDLGGLGLDDKSAENILSILNQENQPDQTKIKAPARIKVPEDRKSLQRDVEYNLAEAMKDKPVLEKKDPNQMTQVAVVPEKLEAPDSPGLPKDPKLNSLDEPESNSLPIIKPAPRPAPKRNPITKIERTGTGKIKMDDIRSIPKVLSPVDELRYMNLRTFRNLSPDPERRIEIILEKLELFRKSEYSKKVAGINAWRLSPVNQIYVSILKSSISNGQPIEKAITEQLKQNPDFLTLEEFNEIVKLNRQLEY